MKLIAILLLASLTGAVAQPTESVTVTGERAREEQIQGFVQSRAAPSVRLGKVARWELGICPAVAGLKPELIRFVVQRLKDIAAKVGAPVNPSTSCRTNVEIVFT